MSFVHGSAAVVYRVRSTFRLKSGRVATGETVRGTLEVVGIRADITGMGDWGTVRHS